jgi:hypothetical protein
MVDALRLRDGLPDGSKTLIVACSDIVDFSREFIVKLVEEEGEDGKCHRFLCGFSHDAFHRALDDWLGDVLLYDGCLP